MWWQLTSHGALEKPLHCLDFQGGIAIGDLFPQSFARTHFTCPCSTKHLALAAKLQARVAQNISSLAPEEHPQLHLVHHTLCLEVAARQNDIASMRQCLGKLQPYSAQMLAPQRSALLGMIAGKHSVEVQAAGCQLLLDSITADGSMEALALMAHLYLQGRSATDPVASPLFGDFSGFPPMLIHASKGDILYDDAVRLADVIRDAGGDLTVRLWTAETHVWEQTGSARARESIDLACQFIERCLD